MNIDQYIDWQKIWDEEVCLDVDFYDNHETQAYLKGIIDDDVALLESECEFHGDSLLLVFGEYGIVANESGSVGSFFAFHVEVNADFFITSIKFEQG